MLRISGNGSCAVGRRVLGHWILSGNENGVLSLTVWFAIFLRLCRSPLSLL